MDELRKKTLVGSIWTMIERFGYLSVQFISNLVLARLLTPADFGTIGILMVFIMLSNIFVDSGFSASLIQKKSITDIDKSTVFYTNLVMAVSVYCVIFIFSPLVASFFNIPELTYLLRILEIIVIIDAFCAIQNTLLMRDMNFKRLTKIKLVSIIVAASVSIALAYWGMGVWALIIQYLLYSILRTTITWAVANWHPIFAFSKESFKTLFSYGSKLLMSTFVAELYINFQQILIGRFYTPSDLGYYSQARQFQQIPTGTISQVINSVAFPAYAKIQDDRKRLKEMFRQNVRVVCFLNTPLMVLLAVIAEPLIVLLYSEKWIGSIGYFQFLCVCFGILLVIHQCSLSVLKAVGRSDYVLKLEIVKKILGIILILLGIKIWGLWGILYALGINSFVEIFLNGYCIHKELGYGGLDQLRDLMPSLFVSTLAGSLSYWFLKTYLSYAHEFFSTISTTAVFVVLYIGFAYIGRLYGIGVIKTILKKTFTKHK